MNIRTRWALVIGLTLATISTTMLLSNNVPVVVKDGNGVNQTFMVVQNAAGGLVAENAICDGQAAAACATVKGSSSAAAATDSAMVVALTPNSPAVTSPQAATFSWPPGTAPVTGVGSFTTSPAAGSNFVSAVQIGSAPTLTVSQTAGGILNPPFAIGSSITLTVSGTAGNNFVAPVAIGSAPTIVTSASSTSLATITSPQTGSVSWPPGPPAGLVPGLSNTAITGTPAQGVGTSSPVSIASGSTGYLTMDTNSNLRTVASLNANSTGGCTSTYVTASTSSVLTNVKGSAGTLCWLRIINASPVTALVKVYDSASGGQDNLVCGNAITLPVSYDVIQPNTVSAGLVGNLGPYGMALASGIDICLSGFNGNFSISDKTSLTTNAIMLNVGFK